MNSMKIAAMCLLCLSACAPTHDAGRSALSDFETLSSERASLVYRNLDQESQKELWRASLEREVLVRSGAERAYLETVLANFDDVWAHPDDYAAEANRVLGEAGALELFAQLGSLMEGDLSPAAMGEVDGVFKHEACTTNESWGCGRATFRHLCSDFACTSNCAGSSVGCGWFLAQRCNARVTGVTDCSP